MAISATYGVHRRRHRQHDGIAELVVVEHKDSGKDCFLRLSTLLELLRNYMLAPATTSEGLRCPYAFSTMQGDNLVYREYYAILFCCMFLNCRWELICVHLRCVT